MKHSIEIFLGSCAVYVIVAACSSGGSSIQNSASLGGSSNSSQTTASLGGSTNSSSMLGSSGTMGTSNGSGGTLDGAGGGSVALNGGAQSSSSQSSSTIIDAGPVPDAMAQTDSGTTGPQVNTVACDTTITSGSSTNIYAVMSYPGRTVAQLGVLHAVGVYTTANAAGTHTQVSAILEDGKARVSCGSASTRLFSSVIFVLPQA